MIDNKQMLNKIEQRLSELGKTKQDLFDDLGLTKGAYSKWKNNHSAPARKTVEMIAEYLGVSPEWLRAKKETPEIGDLSIEEKLVISLWRQCGEKEKAAIAQMLDTLRSSAAHHPGGSGDKE